MLKEILSIGFVLAAHSFAVTMDAEAGETSERTFKVVTYSPQQVDKLKRDAGDFPKRWTIPQPGEVLAVFETTHPHAKKFEQYASIVTESSELAIQNYTDNCTRMQPVNLASDRTECSAGFLNILEVLHD